MSTRSYGYAARFVPLCKHVLRLIAHFVHHQIVRLREGHREFVHAFSGRRLALIVRSGVLIYLWWRLCVDGQHPELLEAFLEVDAIMHRELICLCSLCGSCSSHTVAGGSVSVDYELSYAAEFPYGHHTADMELQDIEEYDMAQFGVNPELLPESEEDTSAYPPGRSDSPPPPWVPIGGWDLPTLRDLDEHSRSSSPTSELNEEELQSMLALEESIVVEEQYEWFRTLFPDEEAVLTTEPPLEM